MKKLLDTLTSLPLSLKKEYESPIVRRVSKFMNEKDPEINKLFTVHLNPLLSFIDYGLIEFIIKKFGSEELKKDMRSYCSEIKMFMKETTIKQLIDYLPGQPETPHKFSLIEAKIGDDASKCTLQQIDTIRKKYCSEVKLSEIVFHLVAVVDSNSFIIRWVVPAVLVDNIMKYAREVKTKFFQKHKITYLTLDGMWLHVNDAELEVMWLHMSTTKLIDRFHTIHKQIILEMKHRTVDELSRCLRQQHPKLQKNTSTFLSEEFLDKHYPPPAPGSFLEFEFFNVVIARFGSDSLKNVMKSYCSYMSVFIRQFTAQQLLDLPPVDTKLKLKFNDKQFVKVKCKIMKEVSEYSCYDIIRLKNSICTEVNFDQFVIILNSIQRSLNGSASLTITWLISTVLVSDYMESANQISADRIETFCVGNAITSFSIHNQWVYNPNLFQFSANLRKRYELSQQSPPPVQWIPSPTRKIFRLAMIKREGVQRGHIMGDRFVQMTVSGRVDDILQAKSSLKLENIFGDTNTNEIILIEGAPGSGKSTLAVHICQIWGKGELFQHFTVVILVQLRDPAVQRAQTIADLLPVENVVANELADSLISTNGHGLLWVLDGWDELPAQLQQNSLFSKLSRRMLSECSVVITSRPVSSADLHSIVSLRIEVLGFTPEEQTQYFTECFKEDTKALEALLEKIEENPMVQSICYLPLNAAFIVYTFKHKNQFLPNTEYEIYLSIILSCIQRHFEREGRGHYLPRHLASLDDLSRSEAVREPFQRLCELAYHGVMKNKVTFSSIDLPRGSSTLSLLQAIESFLRSGKSVFYNFLHLSIQEVLSGYHIATQLSESDQVTQFQRLFNHPRFAVVFQFYAAITKLKIPGIYDQVIARTVGAGSKPLLVSLFRCIYEAQDPSLCLYVAERLNNQLNLEDMYLSPLDCLSISFFLSSVKEFTATIWRCSIGDLSVKCLTKYLGNDNIIDHVSAVTIAIDGNEIHEEGASYIARMLYSVSHLYMSHNQIGDTGISSLSEAIRGTAMLKTLVLACCSITSKGAEDLSAALAQNNSLEKLDISSNHLGDEGIRHLAKALERNEQLKELHIGDCGMTDKGAAFLADALSVNSSLKMLDMGGLLKGALTEDGLSSIAQSLTKSSEFVKLTVSSQFNFVARDNLLQNMNEIRKKSRLQPIEIEGE